MAALFLAIHLMLLEWQHHPVRCLRFGIGLFHLRVVRHIFDVIFVGHILLRGPIVVAKHVDLEVLIVR